MSKRQKIDQKQIFNTLSKELRDLVNSKPILHQSVEQFFYDIVDEMTIGIIFDQHRKYKTNAYDLEMDDSDDEDCNDMDIFDQQNSKKPSKKPQECVCPNCDRAVAANRFAPHLESCMGMGRKCRSRNASRRAASVCSKDTGYSSSYSGGVPSDDEDDKDWSSGEKKRNKKKDRNGSKKSRGKEGTPKKMLESDLIEAVNVDIEGDDEELTNLRSILHLQDHSSSTSPADSASSSGSTKKRDKSKKKLSKQNKDRLSPCSNASAD